MKKSLLILIGVLACNLAYSQLYKGKTSTIHFLSKATLEDIEATNKNAVVVLDATSGAVQVQAEIKAFKFASSFMESHFNENYLESPKYRFATFKGKITEKVDFSKPGDYPVTCVGKMDMHGVNQEVSIPGTLKINGTEITLVANFKVKPADYKIKIEGSYTQKIASEIAVDINSVLEPFKK